MQFRNAGQTCVCANRIYLQRGIADEFTQKLEVCVRRSDPPRYRPWL
jgi:succinate-semialdehyde dehydrogenase/glutarate-semialdehyde dehydrogenase